MRASEAGLTFWETLFATVTSAVFIALGVAMIWAGSALWHQHTELVGHGVRVKGTMVGFEQIGLDLDDSRVDAGLVPVVRFRTEDGRALTVRASGAPPYLHRQRSGDPVFVVYDPDHPDDARIDELAGMWFAPLLFWLIGFAVVLIPPFAIWRHAYTANAAEDPHVSKSLRKRLGTGS
jgi:hypothetical protein